MKIEMSTGLEISYKVLQLLKKNKDLKKYKDLYISVGCFTNCRECGLTFRFSEKNSFTWCIYEHRNSDQIILNGKPGYICLNGELPYMADSKWHYIKSFSYNQFQEASDYLAEEIIKFYKENKYD